MRLPCTLCTACFGMRSLAVQPLLAHSCLLKLSAPQQMGFGLRFAEIKFSDHTWLQSYGIRILITGL